jgi:hypothetical protein
MTSSSRGPSRTCRRRREQGRHRLHALHPARGTAATSRPGAPDAFGGGRTGAARTPAWNPPPTARAHGSRLAGSACRRRAPGGLPGRLPRRPGRAGELQAEFCRSRPRRRSAPCWTPGRRSSNCSTRAWAQAVAPPPCNWRARCCAANCRCSPAIGSQVAGEAVNAVMLSRRATSPCTCTRWTCRWWPKAPKKRCRPRRPPGRRASVERGGVLVESDVGAIDARIAEPLGPGRRRLGHELAVDATRPSRPSDEGGRMTPGHLPQRWPPRQRWLRYLADLQDYAAVPQPLEPWARCCA